ncbi:hypothetical protein [Janthinobacterium sp. BJB304]|uniref:hypothetical protein n=1 Tax=Janthinobacterium sp. BJB304 TaxID=1572871 RepID=UPI000C1110A6|nr:hypothetical protein [Janthinobacterium sp. BJB304]PHV36894.1 hypothetical protein CSQ95_21825 [Janthinobacterium sp. BJB304]
MFSYRRKVRTTQTTTIWGSGSGATRADACNRITLCVQVEEFGDAVVLCVYETRFLFFTRSRHIQLQPEDVFSIDLACVFKVTATSTQAGDTFLNCALLPSK